MLHRIDEAFDRGLNRIRVWTGWGNRARFTVFPYRGYGQPERIFMQGRVLKYKPIYGTERNSVWRSLVDSYRRFGSSEIHNAHLEVRVGSHSFSLITDEEGYFRLSEPLNPPLARPTGTFWKDAHIRLLKTPWRASNLETTGEFLIPSPHAKYGVISDIDDTILQTHVTSILKLKAIYFTVFKNAAGRRAFREVTAFYQALQLDEKGKRVNPFFYVSNSPWNLYDLIKEFMDINHIPKGPILLRDVGISRKEADATGGHKYSTIRQILDTYPDMGFLLIGDSGEKDADIYLRIAREYPERIRAIYIRDVRSPWRARRITKLIEDVTHVDIRLVSDYRDAALDAAGRELIDLKRFNTFRDQFSQGQR